jgi:myo-inositol 2-dehydrogenase/D-chiro-inositol 1-dehydrogenase
MNKIRYGIIGCGSMGREHIENLRALGGSVVTAVADPAPASREQAAALLEGQVQLFERHADLLASGLCDAVVIASPNFTHAQVMRDALATELHILVEKPLVTTVADGLDLLERARAKPRGIVWVAQEYRYMPPVAEMIRIAHEGGVGRIHQVAIREHREPFYPKVGDWNRFTANTGGTLVEKCCHYFNLMDFILKERPSRVFASGGQRVNHLDERYGGKTPDILDSAYVIVEYPSGARASLDLCMFAENSIDNEHVVIVGAEGKLESLLPSGVRPP